MWQLNVGFSPGKGRWGGRQMDCVGRVPEQEPCALFLVALEEKEERKYVEEGVGGANTSFSSFPFRGTTSYTSLFSSSSSSCRCVTSPFSVPSLKDAGPVSEMVLVVLLACCSQFFIIIICHVAICILVLELLFFFQLEKPFIRNFLTVNYRP